MKVSMQKSKRKLAVLWFSGGGFLFLVMILQSLFGKYGETVSDAWSWFLPAVMPTLSLIIGVLVTDSLGKGVAVNFSDAFLFRLTMTLSFAYLLAIALIIFLQPMTAYSAFELMKQSNLWLGPFQGLVAAALGAFFIKKAA